MNWKKLRSSARVTLTNLRPAFKNFNFEFKDELKNAMSEGWSHLTLNE